jgi:hypothetical protein
MVVWWWFGDAPPLDEEVRRSCGAGPSHGGDVGNGCSSVY